MRPPTRLLIGLGCLGLVLVAGLPWLIENTSPPTLPMLIGLMMLIVGLAVLPWQVLLARHVRAEPEASRVLRRVGLIAGGVAVLGILFGLVATSDADRYAAVMLAILVAGVLGLVGCCC